MDIIQLCPVTFFSADMKEGTERKKEWCKVGENRNVDLGTQYYMPFLNTSFTDL